MRPEVLVLKTIFQDPAPDTKMACLRSLVLGKVLPETVEALGPHPWAQELDEGLVVYKALRAAGVLIPLAEDFAAGVLELPPWAKTYLEAQS